MRRVCRLLTSQFLFDEYDTAMDSAQTYLGETNNHPCNTFTLFVPSLIWEDHIQETGQCTLWLDLINFIL